MVVSGIVDINSTRMSEFYSSVEAIFLCKRWALKIESAGVFNSQCLF